MKIVFTSHTYEPYKDGVQVVNKYLLEGIAKKGNQVVLFTTSHPDAPEEETINGVRIIRMPIYRIHCINRGDKKNYRKHILEETSDADVMVNIAVQTPWTDWCYDILDKISCRKVLYLHGMYDFSWHRIVFSSIASLAHKVYNNIRWRLYYLGAKSTFLKYDAVTFLHPEDISHRFFLKKYGVDGTIIENAAENEFFQPIDRSIGIDIPQKYGIFVGNYLREKNQEFVVRAFYESNVSADMALIFIGSEQTPYLHYLKKINEQLSDKFGKRDVRFLLSVPRNETREYIKRASIYLVGSKYEMYPMSVVESMASGVPFISRPVGCVPYLPGGTIVNSEHEMARWIEILYDNIECAQKLGNAGKEYAIRNQSIDVSVDKLMHVMSNSSVLN